MNEKMYTKRNNILRILDFFFKIINLNENAALLLTNSQP